MPPRAPASGDEFLAHVERCRALLHVVELAPPEGAPDARARLRGRPRRARLDHGAGLDRLPELVVLSKRDLLPDEEVDAARRRLGGSGSGIPSWACSPSRPRPAPGSTSCARDPRGAAAGRRARASPRATPAEFEAEHITYRPAAEQGYAVEQEEDGAFRVHGRGVELLVARHDLSNHEALGYLEQRLIEMGVVAALRSAGFEPGDEVRIGEETFELDP